MRYARNTLMYWLVLEGIGERTAARIVAMDRRREDPLPHFPSDADRIRAAFEGFAEVVNDL